MQMHLMLHRAAIIGGVILLAFILFYCEAAGAYGSLRCQGRIIDPGTTMSQVLALCGPPQSRMAEEVPVRSRLISGYTRLAGIVITERWVYDRGFGKFPAVLTFQDGMLRRVDYLRYRSGSRQASNFR